MARPSQRGIEAELFRDLSEAVDFEPFFRKAARGAAELLSAEGVGLALQKGTQWTYRFFEGAPPHIVKRASTLRGHLNEGVVGRALTTGESVYAGLRGNPPEALAPLAELDIKACYAVPMRINGHVEGALTIAWRTNPGRKPTHMQARFIETLAGFMGAAYYRSQLEAALKLGTHHDILTGLPNRILLMDRLERAQLRALRQDRLLAVALLGIDPFKQINDSMGHPDGDSLLAAVSSHLLGSVRSCDTVARLGGHEFVLLLENIAQIDQIETILGRVTGALSRPITCEGTDLYIDFSIGFTVFPLDDNHPDVLLHHAGEAMRAVKRAGGRACRCYEHKTRLAPPPGAAHRAELAFGLEQGTWSIAYSPICRQNGDTAGVEAQLLWHHPHRGLVRADQLLNGHDHPLLSRATQRLLDLTAEFLPIHESASVALHLNIGASDLDEPGFLETLGSWLKITRLPPERLVVELPETALITRLARVREIALGLAGSGIRLILDDIRPGSEVQLGPLVDLPFHGIKCALSAEPAMLRLAASLGRLARALNLVYYADHIDDLSTHAFAQDAAFGFSCVQGSWIAPPINEKRLADWLKTRSHQSGARHPRSFPRA